MRRDVVFMCTHLGSILALKLITASRTPEGQPRAALTTPGAGFSIKKL